MIAYVVTRVPPEPTDHLLQQTLPSITTVDSPILISLAASTNGRSLYPTYYNVVRVFIVSVIYHKWLTCI